MMGHVASQQNMWATPLPGTSRWPSGLVKLTRMHETSDGNQATMDCPVVNASMRCYTVMNGVGGILAGKTPVTGL